MEVCTGYIRFLHCKIPKHFTKHDRFKCHQSRAVLVNLISGSDNLFTYFRHSAKHGLDPWTGPKLSSILSPILSPILGPVHGSSPCFVLWNSTGSYREHCETRYNFIPRAYPQTGVFWEQDWTHATEICANFSWSRSIVHSKGLPPQICGG